MTVENVAKAFVNGQSANCHNAVTNGTEYYLHGNKIAHKADGKIAFDWCGWYTPTTANHLNTIANAAGLARVSYAKARDEKQTAFKPAKL